MKKSIRNFISIMAIVLAFCFALTACGGGATDSGNGSTSESISSSGTGKVSITFSCGESLTMNEWETVRITASSTDKASVTLTADDKSVLYLRGSSVTALKAGTTTITAKTKTGSAIAKLNVTVKEKAENPQFMGNPAIIKVCRMLYYILSKTARRGIEPFIYGHFSLILRDYFE